MLCQNCGKNEATMHLRRIINGETAELHLCPSCGSAMGYSMGFSPFGLGGIFGGLFADLTSVPLGGHIVRCEKCGYSFDDIVKNGSVGCDECYSLFADKISASVEKVHKNAVYCGKKPENKNSSLLNQEIINSLKSRLEDAVARQDFELAVKLRDEIKARDSDNI